MIYYLFIVKKELTLFCVFAFAQRIFSFLTIIKIYEYFARSAKFKHYPDRFSHTLPVAGQRKNIIRVESCHTAVEHYRGGCPIPRAPSLYNGGLYKSAITCIDVGFFSPLFTFSNPFQTTKSQGLSDLHP
jgi:hypothetical protein